MEIKRLQPDHAKQWDDFIAQSNNGTIFHTLKCLSYHPAQRFKDHHLMVFEHKNLIAVFPAIEENRTIISHKRASYGGLVVDNSLGIHDICQIQEQITEYFRKNNFNELILTQPPLIYYRMPHQYIDFALMKYGFNYRKREITAVITLDQEEPLNSFRDDARRSTKKAIREGVVVKIDDDFNTFYKILEKNLGMRHNVRPTHTLEELLKLRKLFPKEIILFSAYYNNKMLGGIVTFATNPNVVLAFYISHDNQYQEYRPVNILFYEVIKWSRQQKYRYLDLGTFTLNMEPNWGLGRFKETHNARGFLRDTYQITLKKNG